LKGKVKGINVKSLVRISGLTERKKKDRRQIVNFGIVGFPFS